MLTTALGLPQRSVRGTAERVAASAGLEIINARSSQGPSRPVRWYQLSIQNETTSSFGLCTAPKKPKHGQLRGVVASVTPGRTWIVATAAFGFSETCGDVLEFPLSFSDAEGRGFTVRVHCHDKSPLRSDALSAHQALGTHVELEEVPNLVARPPVGYEDSLGIYSTPGREEKNRLGSFKVGDQILVGASQGRWRQVTAPTEGWVLFETRDGVPLFQELPGAAAHIRQTVTLKSLPGGKPLMRLEKEPAVEPKGADPDRLAEMKAYIARQQVHDTISKRNAHLEEHRLLGARKRQQWKGVL